MKIIYLSPSYRRPEKSITQEAYPFVKLVVAESERAEYESNGNEVVACPDEVQGNISRVRNWILEQYLPHYDCVILMDDDISYMGRWNKRDRLKFAPEELMEFCEMHSIICKDAGLKLWGVNLAATDKGWYSEHSPFGFNHVILGPFMAHMQGTEIRYDETIPLKEDYDMSLMHLWKYRGVLRVNYGFYHAKHGKQPGGCAGIRNIEAERKQFMLLQEKWGSDVVQRDTRSNKDFDYNPKIKLPYRTYNK